MKTAIAAAFLAALFMLPAYPAPADQASSTQPLAQLSTPKTFDMSTITCAEFLNLSLNDRGYLLMMYAGYISAKSGNTKFVTADLRARAQKITDFCAANPKTLMFKAVARP